MGVFVGKKPLKGKLITRENIKKKKAKNKVLEFTVTKSGIKKYIPWRKE